MDRAVATLADSVRSRDHDRPPLFMTAVNRKVNPDFLRFAFPRREGPEWRREGLPLYLSTYTPRRSRRDDPWVVRAELCAADDPAVRTDACDQPDARSRRAAVGAEHGAVVLVVVENLLTPGDGTNRECDDD